MKKENQKINILYIDDDVQNLKCFDRIYSLNHQVWTTSSTQDARSILNEHDVHVLIVDQRMPDENGLDFIEDISNEFPLCAKVILSAYSDRHLIRKAFQSQKIMDFILKPFDPDDMENVIQQGFALFEKNLRRERREQEFENLCEDTQQNVEGFSSIVGHSRGLGTLVSRIQKICDSSDDTTVLIRGENGTGKELAARAIHYNSSRKDGPFIAVNCPALSENLWESELFGHEKGAFSNAIKRKIGRFELADKGTLFLDEISEIPTNLQVKLLRVIQEKVIERVGGMQSIPMDVRIIAATNRNLEKEVQRGKFRKDLYFRLNVIPIDIPPLRDHPEDIPELLEHFLEIANRKSGKHCFMGEDTLQKLLDYHWPGNIRELEHLVERAVILSDHDELNLDDFIVDLFKVPTPKEKEEVVDFSAVKPLPPAKSAEEIIREQLPYRLQIQLEEIERYKEALKVARGNISEAARALGIHRRTLTDRLRKAELI